MIHANLNSVDENKEILRNKKNAIEEKKKKTTKTNFGRVEEGDDEDEQGKKEEDNEGAHGKDEGEEEEEEDQNEHYRHCMSCGEIFVPANHRRLIKLLYHSPFCFASSRPAICASSVLILPSVLSTELSAPHATITTAPFSRLSLLTIFASGDLIAPSLRTITSLKPVDH